MTLLFFWHLVVRSSVVFHPPSNYRVSEKSRVIFPQLGVVLMTIDNGSNPDEVMGQPFISRKFPWINSGWEDVCCDPAGAHLLSVHGRAWLRLRQNLRCSGGSDTAPLLTLTPAQLWVVTTISCTQQIFMSSECQVMKWWSSILN